MAQPMYTLVKLASDYEEENQVKGRFLPQRVYADPVQTSVLMVNSRDRISGNDFDFLCDLLRETTNCRTIQLKGVMMPLLPQINDRNNVITVVHADGTASVTLENGYYTVQSLVNELGTKLTSLWVGLDATNVVIVNYDPDGRTITITDGNGESWYFDSGCSFIRYGVNVVEFEAGVSTNGVVQTSISLQMVYTRYLTVYSRRLTEDSRLQSRSTDVQSSHILAILDVLTQTNSDQFQNGTAFPTTAKMFYCDEFSGLYNVLNRQKAIRIIDIELEDEFGFNVSTIYNAGFKYPTSYIFKQFF